MATRVARPDGAKASFRELASAADVSVSTLRHYFGDRDGAVAAAMAEMRRQGESWMTITRTAELDLPLAASLRWFLDLFVVGWERGVGAMIGQSMAAGMNHEALGPAVVDDLLEPTLQATEARLAHHQARGDLDPAADLRHAALALVCPVLVALLHQRQLGGACRRPLDLPTLLDDHVARFVRAWGP
ncbi:MAG: TetR/AcrR family transcriptional regulator [Myxococcota bacterium]